MAFLKFCLTNIFATGFCLFGVIGCASVEFADVRTEYAKASRAVGLFPVYPPREGFQIGDVYAWSMSDVGDENSVSVFLTTLPALRDKADEFMNQRVLFANTQLKAGNLSLSQEDFIDQPGLAVRSQRMLSPEAHSLPIAAFPSITADAGFSAGVGVNQTLYALGLAGGERTTVTLNYNDVRTYWVPAVDTFGSLQADLKRILAQYYDPMLRELNRQVSARAGQSAGACGAGRRCGVSVITKVYLTRKVTYTYRNSRIVSAAIRRIESGGNLSAGTNESVSGINITIDGNGDVDQSASNDQVQALRTAVEELSKSTTNGETLQFEAWDARGATFSQIMQRPVVIGWDGPQYEF